MDKVKLKKSLSDEVDYFGYRAVGSLGFFGGARLIYSILRNSEYDNLGAYCMFSSLIIGASLIGKEIYKSRKENQKIENLVKEN